MDLAAIVPFFLFKGADDGPAALKQPHPVYDQAVLDWAIRKPGLPLCFLGVIRLDKDMEQVTGVEKTSGFQDTPGRKPISFGFVLVFHWLGVMIPSSLNCVLSFVLTELMCWPF